MTENDQLPLRFEAQPWASDALCAQTDPEIFFPEKGGSVREAKATCRRCTVAAECLTYALDTGEPFGIWGGITSRDRRRLLNLTTPTPPDRDTTDDVA